MRLATVQQSREIDATSQAAYGLNADVLMEAAGALAAREIEQMYYPELHRGMTAIVCGPGHNGGDGLVIARHLHSAGHRDLTVFLEAPEAKRAKLFSQQLERCRMQGLRIVDLGEQRDKLDSLRSAELIVDALFGVGFSGSLEGAFAKTVDVINSSRRPVVAVDTPSGLNADTGLAVGSVVQAALTLTFGLAKPGFFTGDGPAHVGRLKILPIGFPAEALRGIATTHFLFTERLARRYLPARKETSNKSDHGHLLVIAGHEGMWGAAVLAASSAYRVGVGYVTWSSRSFPAEHLESLPEVLTAPMSASPWRNPKVSAVAIGPGLGVTQDAAEVLSQLKREFQGPVVVDADALSICSQFGLWPLPKHWVVTPHLGELARILGTDARDLERDRFAAALAGAKKVGCHLLLKGYRSILAYEERCMVINSGNVALAKAGTGDVLTGMIGGLLAQGPDTLQGVATAAFLHGRLADEWVRTGRDQRALLASDVRDHLPDLLARLAGGSLL